MIRIAGRILTISLWPSLMYDLLARFANNQGVVQPALYVGIVVLLLNAFFNWLFIYAFKLGYAGSPLATCTSRWISPILLFGLLYRQGLFRRSWFGLRVKEAIAPSQVLTDSIINIIYVFKKSILNENKKRFGIFSNWACQQQVSLF